MIMIKQGHMEKKWGQTLISDYTKQRPCFHIGIPNRKSEENDKPILIDVPFKWVTTNDQE